MCLIFPSATRTAGMFESTSDDGPSSVYLVISLYNSILGSAMLSLPYCFSKVGVPMGIVLLAATCWLNVVSADALLVAAQATGQRSYVDIASRTMGSPGRSLVRFLIFSLQIGTLVGYMDITGEALYFMVMGIEGCSLFHFQCLLVILLLLPLSIFAAYKEDVLNYTSFFSVVLIMAFIVEVSRRAIFHLIFGDAHDGAGYAYDGDAPVPSSSDGVGHHSHSTLKGLAAGSNSSFFPELGNVITAMPVMSFCYSNQVAFFSIYAMSAKQSSRKMARIATRALMLSFATFAILGTAGYIAYGDATMNDILVNLKDSLGDMYRVLYAISCICTVPIVCVPLGDMLGFLITAKSGGRNNAGLLAAKEKHHQTSSHPRGAYPAFQSTSSSASGSISSGNSSRDASSPQWLVLLPSLAMGFCVSLCICYCVEDVEIVFGITGGTASALLAYVLPGVMILILGQSPSNAPMRPLQQQHQRRRSKSGFLAMFLPSSDVSSGRARALIGFGILLLVLGTNATLVKLFGEERAGFDRDTFIEEGIDPGVHGTDYNEDMQQSRGGGARVDEPREPLLARHSSRRRHESGSTGGGAGEDAADMQSDEPLNKLIDTLGEVVEADRELESKVRGSSKKSSKSSREKEKAKARKAKVKRATDSHPPALDEYIEETIRRDESLLESVESALKQYEGGRERQAALDRPGQLSEAQELELKHMAMSLPADAATMSKEEATKAETTSAPTIASDNVQQRNDSKNS